ncbi:1-(5-phosphoribosyl)-5-[(5-phosphoribosylamino)methylideneamino]imidazole-4-carboxamide isomerase [bacterium]|nr:1-(5-phosphoribosyl)-5-[(5-phosphoribosylamino)methylideneamino]imidazole-4-carboxamide isomerase [bacterium]
MKIIPAIDLKDGKCVRLQQGDYAAKTEYAMDPLEMAQKFEAAGAKRIHVIDLDGAKDGLWINRKTVEKIVSGINIPIQMGGGVRSLADVRDRIEAGVDRVIIGTVAIKKPSVVAEAVKEFGGEHLIVGIDARDNRVAVTGWTEVTEIDATELAVQMKALGVPRINYTDISRDGMFTGPNIPATRQLAEMTGLKITASGGVSSLQDIINLREIEACGVDSVIVGKAIYEGKITLAELFD